MAEEEGFEPPSPVRVNLISSQTHSATLPLFQSRQECAKVRGKIQLGFMCCA